MYWENKFHQKPKPEIKTKEGTVEMIFQHSSLRGKVQYFTKIQLCVPVK